MRKVIEDVAMEMGAVVNVVVVIGAYNSWSGSSSDCARSAAKEISGHHLAWSEATNSKAMDVVEGRGCGMMKSNCRETIEVGGGCVSIERKLQE